MKLLFVHGLVGGVKMYMYFIVGRYKLCDRDSENFVWYVVQTGTLFKLNMYAQ